MSDVAVARKAKVKVLCVI